MSLKTPFIARASDGLILCESYDQTTDNVTEKLKHSGRDLLRKISSQSYANVSDKIQSTVDASDHKFHYQIENGVIYLNLAESTYP